MASYFLPVTQSVAKGQKSSTTTQLRGRIVGLTTTFRDGQPIFSFDFAIGAYHFMKTPVDVRTIAVTAVGGLKVPVMFRHPFPSANATLTVLVYNTDQANSGDCNLTFIVDN